MSNLPAQAAPRRHFLARLAAGAAALATGSVARSAGAAEATARALAPDERWLTKLTGTHRQIVDAYSTNDGWPLAFTLAFLNSNHATYGLPDSKLTAVVGLRHFGMPMALPDTIWSRYKIGDSIKVMDPATNAPAVRNRWLNAKPGELMFPDMSIEKLQARGVIFTVCNVALTALSGMFAPNAGVTPEAAKAEWTAAVLPGMTIVPAGVLALNRAQERGCHYCTGGGA